MKLIPLYFNTFNNPIPYFIFTPIYKFNSLLGFPGEGPASTNDPGVVPGTDEAEMPPRLLTSGWIDTPIYPNWPHLEA